MSCCCLRSLMRSLTSFFLNPLWQLIFHRCFSYYLSQMDKSLYIDSREYDESDSEDEGVL